jgi:hypothetical protein
MTAFIDKIKFRLKFLHKRPDPIPSMDVKRNIIDQYREQFHPKCFVETGTFLGDTVSYFKDKFESVISIELSVELAAKARKKI